jgi:3-deoxy-D-manno-octulosonic-acid transferase
MRKSDQNGVAPWLGGRAGAKPIWIHCASGEFEYAKPVITEIKRRAPEQAILVTYFSPSIAGAAHKFPGVDFACPTPWERPEDWRQFLEHHDPRALLIARTDTWPEMLLQARLKGLPTLLFSATLARASGRTRGPARALSKAVFGLLTDIFCVTSEDQTAFVSLGATQTQVAGDTRFDQVQARLLSPKPIRDELFALENSAPVLVAGSTWSEDEAVLAPVAASLKGRVRFVLVPHEPTPHHLEELEALLKSKGLTFVRYSHAKAWKEDVLLVDQIGILAELYQKGRFAFVGGSFKKTVHSVMEPLAAGALTFVGPLHENNREALEFATLPAVEGRLTCVQPVADVESFVTLLEAGAELFTVAHAEKIRKEIEVRSGKSARVADWALAIRTDCAFATRP